jgi:hypothetical protein
VRIKSDDDTFSAAFSRQALNFFQNAPVAGMYAIERSDGDDGIPEIWELI